MIFLKGDGAFDFEIVAESFYQRELRQLAGPKTEKGCSFEGNAGLVRQDNNPHDPNAVQVCIVENDTGRGLSVGYLSRDDAVQIRIRIDGLDIDPQAILFCRAKIVGGWLRKEAYETSEGAYGVKLDLDWPVEIDPAYSDISLTVRKP